jgi:hypothetical protein
MGCRRTSKGRGHRHSDCKIAEDNRRPCQSRSDREWMQQVADSGIRSTVPTLARRNSQCCHPPPLPDDLPLTLDQIALPTIRYPGQEVGRRDFGRGPQHVRQGGGSNRQEEQQGRLVERPSDVRVLAKRAEEVVTLLHCETHWLARHLTRVTALATRGRSYSRRLQLVTGVLSSLRSTRSAGKLVQARRRRTDAPAHRVSNSGLLELAVGEADEETVAIVLDTAGVRRKRRRRGTMRWGSKRGPPARFSSSRSSNPRVASSTV